MDSVLMATRITYLHASYNVRTPSLSSSILQLSCNHPPFLSYQSKTTTMNSFFRPSVSKSRFLIIKKHTFPTRALKKDQSSSSSKRNLVMINSVITVFLAIANRVLYKLALVPMKPYPFFLAQFITFGYVLIYFTILYTRCQLGIVSYEMLQLPKWRFVVICFLEALGVATGMAAAAMLPGPVIPILNQTFLVWQLLFAVLILGRRFLVNQIGGCLLVVVGVVVAVSSGSGADRTLSGIGFLWPGVLVASAAFSAGASIIKEFVFNDAAKRLEGKSLDIFVVNSFGSGFQALFVFLLLPLLSNLKGIPFASLPSYFKAGAGCFFNTGATVSGCDGSPILPLLYITTNLAFNISLLHLVKISSAIVASLTVTLAVPLSVYIMSKPLPYLPGGTSLSSNFMAGSIVLVLGLLLYNIPMIPTKQDTKTS